MQSVLDASQNREGTEPEPGAVTLHNGGEQPNSCPLCRELGYFLTLVASMPPSLSSDYSARVSKPLPLYCGSPFENLQTPIEEDVGP